MSLFHYHFSSGSLGLLAGFGNVASRNTAKDCSAAQLAATDVVAEEQSTRGVACSVEALGGLIFQSDYLSVGVDLRSTEGGGHAGLPREGIERTLVHRVRVLVDARRIQILQRVVLQRVVVAIDGGHNSFHGQPRLLGHA